MLLGSMTVLAAIFAVLTCALGHFSGAAIVFGTLGCFVGYWLGLFAIAFAVLWVSCATVDISKPQEQDSKYFRRLTKLYIPAVVSLLRMDVQLEGAQQLPKDGRFLLICNHLNILDPVLLLGCFPEAQLAFISKRENADMFLIGKIMHRLMCQLINRENDREALKTILKCIQLIKDDEVSIAVFPEGYISKDHHLQKLRSGALKIATKAKVPIAVCTIQGTDKVVGNLKRLKSSTIELHLIDVISVEAQQGRTATDIGDQIYQMMAADLGPDYAPLDAETP